MTALLLNGKQLAEQLQQTLAATIQNRTHQGLRPPGLAVILINDSQASTTYVRHKRLACERVGIKSYNYDLPFSTTEEALIELIHELNLNKAVDGILVQLPLPPHINTFKILECIDPYKDVDGFHPYNLGRLAQQNPTLRPCTPYGIMQLLKAYKLPISGQHAVIVGTSNIVGRPMALEMLMAKATVTLCNRSTKHLAQHVQQADLLIVATGSYGCVKPDWLHPKQIVIDVGAHKLANGKFSGDLNLEEAKQRVAWITPVPGGVGPMTVTTLLQNTLTSSISRT